MHVRQRAADLLCSDNPIVSVKTVLPPSGERPFILLSDGEGSI